MGLLTFGVKRSSQFRGKIHNGFWLWKLIALIGILIGMIFAIQKVEEDLFLFWWKNIGLVTGSMFVCWQMYVFIKFAATWSKSWYIASEPRYKGQGFMDQNWKFMDRTRAGTRKFLDHRPKEKYNSEPS